MNTKHPVREFIVQNFLFGEEGRVNEDTSFLQANIVDSTGMLELASFLEERYGVSISDEELIPENLDSLNNISHFLERKLDGCMNVQCANPLEQNGPPGSAAGTGGPTAGCFIKPLS